MSERDTYLPGHVCKAARALLGWKRDRLAYETGFHPSYISEYERHFQRPRHRSDAKKRQIDGGIRRVLTDAGIDFVLDHRGIIGCCLREGAREPQQSAISKVELTTAQATP